MKISLGSQTEWQEKNLEHMRYEYPMKAGDVVLDIGSYRREFGQQFELMGCKVEYFDALDNRAAWTHDGTLKMGGQHYYTSMFDEGELGQVREFKCVDIAPYLQSEVALCKINIEGGEVDLLNYILDKNLIHNIKYLQVQFHLVEGQPSEQQYEEIAKRLSLTHSIEWRYPFVWESWKRG